MNRLILIIIALFIIWLVLKKSGDVSYGAGVFAPDIPLQGSIQSPTKISFDHYTLTPLASFEIKAKVLAKENYNFGRESELSPTDLALGWGRMSDESVIEQLEISQSGRWYRWNTLSNEFPIPRNEIELSSANMHIIPADSLVADNLKRIVKGDIVAIKGSLVKVDSADGWHWVSSLTRNDTGAGACELIYVESLTIEKFNN